MRKLSPAARQERRRQVIKLRRKGLSYEAIAAELGLSRTGVFNICKRFDEGGAAALRDQPCGRPTGASRALSPEQEREIRRLVIDHTPDQLKMDFALWSRQAVALLITQRFGVSARVILTHCAKVNVTHLGEDDGLLGAVDVDPGGSSGDTSDGPKGRIDQGDSQAVWVFAQHGAPVPA